MCTNWRTISLNSKPPVYFANRSVGKCQGLSATIVDGEISIGAVWTFAALKTRISLYLYQYGPSNRREYPKIQHKYGKFFGLICFDFCILYGPVLVSVG